jgi:hypothetical protein
MAGLRARMMDRRVRRVNPCTRAYLIDWQHRDRHADQEGWIRYPLRWSFRHRFTSAGRRCYTGVSR